MHVFKPSVEVHQMMKRAILTGLCIVLAFGVAGSFTGVAFSRQIQPSGIRQIQALLEEKAHRTPAQRKLDSHLHLAGQVARGVLSTRQIPAAANAAKMLKFDARQRVHVDIRGTVSKGLLAEIAAMGGVVESSQVQYGAIRAWLPLLKAEALARRADVSFIEPAVMPILNGQLSAHPPRTQRLPAQQREKLRSQLESALRQLEARRSPVPPRREILNTAPVNTDGLISEGADLVQNEGITGDGVKVGVLSDGVDSLASMQIAGNLPNNVTVLSGQAGSGDEGTAMLEIVYDLAPGAELYFATADDSPAQMATNIESLSLAGCNIIVDDVTFLDEGVFQDDVIARAIDVITLNGVLYFSSAGNSGNLDSGTSGTWEGDFDGTGGTIDPIDTIEGQPVTVHAFDASHNYDQVTAASPIGGLTVLQWSDPLGASCNDYDLFHMDSSLQTVIEASNNPQECSEDPLEYVSAPPAGDVIVIVLYSGSPRALNLSTNRGRLAINTAGATFGHNAASSVVTVAATPAQNTIFTAGNQSPESYSSDGPRKIFYYPYGIPLTAGNYLFGTGGGTTLSKVDLTAADCGQSAVPGFDPFCGTSAAAPTAAAIAALIMSAAPTLTPSEVVSVMKSTALAPHAGFNSRTVGAGIAMANSSVDSVLVPLASFSPSSINLGTSPVGTNSSPGIVTLTNTGSSSLSIDNYTIAGANFGDFPFTSNCSAALAAGDSCTFSIHLHPTATGPLRAALVVSDSGADSPQRVILTGVGTAASVSPTSLDFGSQLVGSTSGASLVTVTNPGATAMHIWGTAIVGTNSGDFSHVNSCPVPPATLAGGANCTISVQFTPSAASARTASLMISHDGGGSPSAVSLSGTGTAALTSSAPHSGSTQAASTRDAQRLPIERGKANRLPPRRSVPAPRDQR
jgi:hypothetical protein